MKVSIHFKNVRLKRLSIFASLVFAGYAFDFDFARFSVSRTSRPRSPRNFLFAGGGGRYG